MSPDALTAETQPTAPPRKPGLSAGFRRFVLAPRLIGRLVQLAGLLMTAAGAFERRIAQEGTEAAPEGWNPDRAYFLLCRAVRWADALRARLRRQRREAIWDMPGALMAMAAWHRGPEQARDDAEALAADLARAARRRERSANRAAAREAAAAAAREIAHLSDEAVATQIGADIAEVAGMIREREAGLRIQAVADKAAALLGGARPAERRPLFPEVLPAPSWRAARVGSAGRGPPR